MESATGKSSRWKWHSEKLNTDITPESASRFFRVLRDGRADPFDVAVKFGIGQGAMDIYAANPLTIPRDIAEKIERAILTGERYAERTEIKNPFAVAEPLEESDSEDSGDSGGVSRNDIVKFVTIGGRIRPVRRISRAIRLLAAMGLTCARFTAVTGLNDSFFRMVTSRERECEFISVRSARRLQYALKKINLTRKRRKERAKAARMKEAAAS